MHTRHVGTAWRTQSDGAAGAVKAARPHGRSKRAFDLSHQTLAAWPETRRGSAETGGRAAGAWRSGARRPDRNADREPKGASFRLASASGSGHRCAAAAAQKAARKDEENDDHRQRKRTEEYQVGGEKRERRRRIRSLPPYPEGVRFFWVVHAP